MLLPPSQVDAAQRYNVDPSLIATVQELFPEHDAETVARAAEKCHGDIDLVCNMLLNQAGGQYLDLDADDADDAEADGDYTRARTGTRTKGDARSPSPPK